MHVFFLYNGSHSLYWTTTLFSHTSNYNTVVPFTTTTLYSQKPDPRLRGMACRLIITLTYALVGSLQFLSAKQSQRSFLMCTRQVYYKGRNIAHKGPKVDDCASTLRGLIRGKNTFWPAVAILVFFLLAWGTTRLNNRNWTQQSASCTPWVLLCSSSAARSISSV